MTEERTTRSYQSPVRAQRAAESRARIVDAAGDLFAERGYGGTTMAMIAARAERSVESVHLVGTKAFLLLEAFRVRYAGEGHWDSVLEAEAAQGVVSITDPARAVEALVDFCARAHQASADLWMVMRGAAASEPSVAVALGELVRVKSESYLASVDWMIRIGLVAPRRTTDRTTLAAEVNVVLSAETWVQLVRDWSFDDARYRAWLTATLQAYAD